MTECFPHAFTRKFDSRGRENRFLFGCDNFMGFKTDFLKNAQNIPNFNPNVFNTKVGNKSWEKNDGL